MPGGSPPPVKKGNTPLPPPPIRRGGTPTPGTKAGTPLPPRPPAAGVKKPGAPPGVKKPSAPGAAKKEAAVEDDKRIGITIGKVKLIRRLGRGGMGDVYLGEHTMLQKQVAVKLLPQDFTRNEELLSRFRREAVAAARLEHPNIVQVMDVGNEGQNHYIVMQYVQGKSLQDLLDELGKGMELKEAVRITIGACNGLQSAHEAGIIHRDVKPANVMVSDKGEVKVMDFGLAHDQESQTLITMPGAMMGTPHFMSPEQAEGRPADARSDIYSLGVMLYYAITGQRPFVGESHMAVLYKHINEAPVPPRKLNATIPDAVSRIVLKALSKDAGQRYKSCTDLVKDLEAWVKSGAKLAPAPAGPAPRQGRGTAPARGGTAPVRGGTSQLPQQRKMPSNPGVTPLPTGPNKNKTIIIIACIVAMVLIIGLLVVAVVMQKKPVDKNGDKSELPADPPKDPVKDLVKDPAKDPVEAAKAEAFQKYVKLVARAKELEAKDAAGAVKLYLEASAAWPEGREAKDAIARLETPAVGPDEKAWREIDAYSQEPEGDRAKLLKMCNEFLASHASSARAAQVTTIKEHLVALAANGDGPKLEDGFKWVVPSKADLLTSVKSCTCTNKIEPVGEHGFEVDIGNHSGDHHHVLLNDAKDSTADFALKFDVKVASGTFSVAFRMVDKSDTGMQLMTLNDAPPKEWFSVELAVVGEKMKYALAGKETETTVPSGKPVAGRIGFIVPVRTAYAVRNLRLKVTRRGKAAPPIKDPVKDPVEPVKDPEKVQPLDPAAVAALFGDGKEVAARDYDPLIKRLEEKVAAARELLEPNLARLQGARKLVESAIVALAKTEGEFDIKSRNGQVMTIKVVKKLSDRSIQIEQFGGQVPLAADGISADTLVQFGFKGGAGESVIAAFLLTDGDFAGAMGRFFASAKKLKPNAELEPFVDQVLAMDAVKQLKGGAKEIKTLFERLQAVPDLPAGVKEKLNAITDRQKMAAAAAEIEAIRDFSSKGKHREAVARFSEWIKSGPDDTTIDAMANELYKSFLADGWTKYWDDAKDYKTALSVTNGSSGSLSSKNGVLSIDSPRGKTNLRAFNMKGAHGFAYELKVSQIGGAGTSLIFTHRDDENYKILSFHSTTYTLYDRVKEFNQVKSDSYQKPLLDRWIELAVFTAGDAGFVFVDGKLLHRLKAADVTFSAETQFLVDGTNAEIKNLRWLK